MIQKHHSIAAGDQISAAILENGDLIVKGDIDAEYAIPFIDPIKNVISVAATSDHIVGLLSDGSVFTQRYSYSMIEYQTKDWSDIAYIEAGSYHIIGLRHDGTVVAAGDNEDGQCNIDAWTDIVAVSCGFTHTVGLRSDGTVVAAGSNDYGESNVSEWKNIRAVYAGLYETIAIKNDGSIITTSEEHKEVEKWHDIERIALSDSIIGIKKDGTVAAVYEKSNIIYDTKSWKNIIDAAVGEAHILGLMSDGSLVTTGNTFLEKCGKITKYKNIMTYSKPEQTAQQNKKEYKEQNSNMSNKISLEKKSAETVSDKADDTSNNKQEKSKNNSGCSGCGIVFLIVLIILGVNVGKSVISSVKDGLSEISIINSTIEYNGDNSSINTMARCLNSPNIPKKNKRTAMYKFFRKMVENDCCTITCNLENDYPEYLSDEYKDTSSVSYCVYNDQAYNLYKFVTGDAGYAIYDKKTSKTEVTLYLLSQDIPFYTKFDSNNYPDYWSDNYRLDTEANSIIDDIIVYNLLQGLCEDVHEGTKIINKKKYRYNEIKYKNGQVIKMYFDDDTLFFSEKEDYQPENANLIISNTYVEPELPDKNKLSYIDYETAEAVMAAGQ